MPRWLITAALAAALASGAAAAHNYHMGLADIGYNADTGNTEIVHTYTAHDVETLLANLYGRQFDLGLEEDQEALRRYLDKRFVLTANGSRLPVQWVGIKASADTITVYQMVAGAALPAGTVLKNGVLADFLPGQINTVNVGGSAGRAAATLTFTAAQDEQRLP
ncbi:hypothetical protein OU994_27585 [Pseudoduganella sp. SL102]|uniref:DUF6702 family protein n=1 Tax=Pseudoduganella sp. SL102 TaxID=2995154 RepID=UPI00248CA247|nr:DUF6702 family protein [Pseudoduganella sp. SL102]WBS01976.1 hypothetical protein OU994_27585 [Pseudoduganella sp. SL102]